MFRILNRIDAVGKKGFLSIGDLEKPPKGLIAMTDYNISPKNYLLSKR